MHATNQQTQNQGPVFLWFIGFLALGTLSAIGASSLFPWYLAIVIAILVAGLASACAYQFRVTRNLLYLVATVAMTLLASGLDGVSVWEILNKRHNGNLSTVAAEQKVLENELHKAEQRVIMAQSEIDGLVREAADMDNDGKGENDHLIPGQVALIAAKKADKVSMLAEVAIMRAEVLDATAVTAQTDTGRHVLLQMASQRDNPAQWLIGYAALIFMIPEFTLVLLAWSLRGANEPNPMQAPAPVYQEPMVQAQPQPQHQPLQLQPPKGRGMAALTGGSLNSEPMSLPTASDAIGSPAGFGEIMGITPQPEAPTENITPKIVNSAEETLGDLADAEASKESSQAATPEVAPMPEVSSPAANLSTLVKPPVTTALNKPRNRANKVAASPKSSVTSAAKRTTSAPKSTSIPRRKSTTLAQMAKQNRLN